MGGTIRGGPDVRSCRPLSFPSARVRIHGLRIQAGTGGRLGSEKETTDVETPPVPPPVQDQDDPVGKRVSG